MRVRDKRRCVRTGAIQARGAHRERGRSRRARDFKTGGLGRKRHVRHFGHVNVARDATIPFKWFSSIRGHTCQRLGPAYRVAERLFEFAHTRGLGHLALQVQQDGRGSRNEYRVTRHLRHDMCMSLWDRPCITRWCLPSLRYCPREMSLSLLGSWHSVLRAMQLRPQKELHPLSLRRARANGLQRLDV